MYLSFLNFGHLTTDVKGFKKDMWYCPSNVGIFSFS